MCIRDSYSPVLSATTHLPQGISLRLLSEVLTKGEETARFLGRRFEQTDDCLLYTSRCV